MNTIPVAVEIGGVSFSVVDRLDLEEHFPYSWRPYREFMQSTTVQAADIAGSSRPGKSSRPDQLEWRLDDWSQGEGQKYLDFSQEGTFKQYWYSDGAIDVRTAGSLKLGYQWYQSSTLGGTTRYQGPYLIHRNNSVEAFVDDRVFRSGLDVAAPDTWTNVRQASRTAGNRIAGPPRVLGGWVYAAYKDGTGGANSSDVRAVGNSNTVQVVAQGSGDTGGSNNENALPANNRLYLLKDVSGKLVLNRTADIAPALKTLTTVYAISGVGSEFGMDALSQYVYVVSMHDDGEEEPRIHMYPLPNTTAGGERGFLPTGFRMNMPHGTNPNTDVNAYRAVAVLGDLVFVCGFKQGGTGGVDVPALAYYSASRTGSWTIREGILTTAERSLCLLPATKSLLIIGTDGGRCFAYDIQNGGVSQLFAGITAGENIISLDLYKGVYWAGVRTTDAGTAGTVKTYRTKLGAGQYPASADLYTSQWDFGYPEVNKIIDELEITTKPLVSDEKVDITLYADETAIMTDKLGATLRHSGAGAIKTRFKISGLNASAVSTIRSCRNLRVKITLYSKTSDNSISPEVTAVNIKVLPREFLHFYEAVVAITDDPPGQRELGALYPRTGEQKADLLRTIKEADPPVALAFLPRYRSGTQSMPEKTSTPLEVYLEDCELIYTNKGNGFARVTVRRAT